MASSIPAPAPAEADALAPAVRPRPRRRVRMPWLVMAGLAFLAALIVVAGGATYIAPYDPVRGSLRARLVPPAVMAGDGRTHLLGTDHLGRDVLSRIIHGARVSLIVGFAAVGVGGLVGATLGILAG